MSVIPRQRTSMRGKRAIHQEPALAIMGREKERQSGTGTERERGTGTVKAARQVAWPSQSRACHGQGRAPDHVRMCCQSTSRHPTASRRNPPRAPPLAPPPPVRAPPRASHTPPSSLLTPSPFILHNSPFRILRASSYSSSLRGDPPSCRTSGNLGNLAWPIPPKILVKFPVSQPSTSDLPSPYKPLWRPRQTPPPPWRCCPWRPRPRPLPPSVRPHVSNPSPLTPNP
jgi:hypothetical protein